MLTEPTFYMLLFILSITFTLLHKFDDLCSKHGAIYTYFANLSGVDISKTTGIFLFGILLAVLATVFGYFAYIERSDNFAGILLGLRLGHVALGHLLPVVLTRTNPGFYSAWLYVIEAVLILIFLDVYHWGIFIGFNIFGFVLLLVELLRPRKRLSE